VSAITFTSKQAEVWIGRNGVNGSQNDNCCHWNIGMYSMAGSQTATVEVLTDFVHLTPSPVYKKAGQVVHFQMALDDSTPATVWQWSWTKDPGSNANPLSGCVDEDLRNRGEEIAVGQDANAADEALPIPGANVDRPRERGRCIRPRVVARPYFLRKRKKVLDRKAFSVG
jgi:hypothetical protein